MTQLQKFSNSLMKASSIIGTNLFSHKGESVGGIKEIVIDPDSGRAAYVVVSFGGFLSLGEKLFAVPFSAIEFNADKGEYVLDVSPDRLKEAPGFDPEQWPQLADEKWNRNIYEFYGCSPYWE